MRTPKKMLMAAVLAASLVGMSTGPVMADEDGKDEGATVLQSELPPSERSLLERAGVRGGGGQYPAPRRVHTGFRWAELDNHREREWQRRISDEYRIWCRHLQGGLFPAQEGELQCRVGCME